MKSINKLPRKKKLLTEEEQIEKLASFGLTNKEIADSLGYDDNTLKRRYEIYLSKGRACLKERLKRKQIAVALSGNVSMLIWLGKQYLDQSDSIKENGEIKIMLERKELTSFALENEARRIE